MINYYFISESHTSQTIKPETSQSQSHTFQEVSLTHPDSSPAGSSSVDMLPNHEIMVVKLLFFFSPTHTVCFIFSHYSVRNRILTVRNTGK